MSKIEVAKIGTLTGHRDAIYSVEPGIGSTFFSAAGDGMVVRWDLSNPDTGMVLAKVPKSIYALHLLKDDQELVFGQNFEGIHLINLQDHKQVKSAKITSAAIFDITSYGNFLVAAAGDGVITVMSRKDLSVFNKVKASDHSVRTLAVRPDGTEIAAGYSDNLIRIFELPAFKLKKEILAHNNSVFTLQYSPDGRFLLSGSRDAHLKVWEADSGYILHKSVVAHMYAVNHITFSHSGRHFATCSMDKSIKIWDAEEFRLLKVIDKARHAGHGTSVNKMYWSGFGNYLLSCSDDRTISIWEINNL